MQPPGTVRPFACSIVIPLFNRVDLTEQCLTRLVEVTPPELYEVVLVDNGSTDGTARLLDAVDGDVTIVRNAENLGFSRACNQGAQAARGRHLVFLNNDTEPHEGWLEPLLEVLDTEPDVGIVGARLLFPDGTIQHAGVAVVEDERVNGWLGGVHLLHRAAADHADATRRQDFQVVTGAAMAVRRDVFFELGGFDEGYWNGNEDVDLCFKVCQAGLRVTYEPRCCVVHHESASGPERFSKVAANNQRLSARWRGVVVPDFLLTAGGASRPHPRRTPLSVVVAAANAASTLATVLESALASLRGPDEIVVVDNASSDDTRSIVDAARGRDRRVRLVRIDTRVPQAVALETGVEAATGTHVALLRADARVSRNCFDDLMSLQSTAGVQVAAAPLLDRPGPQDWRAHTRSAGPVAPHPDAAARLVAANPRGSLRVPALADTCILLPRQAVSEHGLLRSSGSGKRWHEQLGERFGRAGGLLAVARTASAWTVPPASGSTRPIARSGGKVAGPRARR